MSTTITNLPETSKVNGSDYLVLDQTDKTVKSTVSNFLADTGVVLATQLKDTDGADLIQSSNGNTVQEELNNNLLNDREQWRRQLADAGLNLVAGSFEAGATVNSATDAVWHIAGGQCYTWGGSLSKTVPAGSTPSSTGGIAVGAWQSSSDVMTKASRISLSQGITVQDAIVWTLPKEFGVKGDGVSDDTASLYNMFKSGKENIRIPRGTYIISSKLKCVISHNLNVECEPGVVFKLANNARCNMMVFVGNRQNNFKWVGGEFDGNWDNQGEETLNGNGTFKDLSHGFTVSLFNEVRLDKMYVHSFRGHSMNHAGNKKLHASNLLFNSHIAQAYPRGGSRGDGITGCSEDVLIENVYGFTTDDMVAVFAGILWVEGGTESDSAMVTNLDYLTCKSVTIRNINPWKKLSDLDGVTEVYTWNGVVVGGQGGLGAEKVHISGVKGYTQYSGVRLGASQPVGNSNATDYYNTMGSVIVDDIDIRVAGDSSNQHLYNIVRIGELFPSGGTAHECIIKSVTLSNIKCWPTGNNRTLIAVGYTTIYTLNISNVTVNGSVADDTYNMIWCAGDRQIARVNINNINHNPPTTTSDAAAQAQLVLYWTVTFAAAAKIYGNGWPIRRSISDTAYVSNMLSLPSAVQPEIYSYDVIFRHDSGFSALPKVKGVHCRDRYLGKVRVALNNIWEFEEFATTYNTSDYGRPSPALMTGYSNISWTEGMFVRTVGSPYGEVRGWRFNKDGNWQMVSEVISNNMVAIIDSTTLPSAFTPYCTIKSPVYNDASWPAAFGAVTLYTGHPNNRADAYEEFVSNTGDVYIRTWNTNTSSWNSFNQIPRIVPAPASASASGVKNSIAFDSTHLYICTATNTWVRVALASW